MFSVRTNRPVRAWLAAVAGVGLLAACSGGGTAEVDQGGGGGSGSPTTSSSYYSPLQEYLSPSAAQGMTNEDFAAKDKQVQELIAPCMQKEGFEYTPFVYPNSSTILGPDQGMQGRDYVAKYGYGISTYDMATATSSSSDIVDPNQAIVEAMGKGEQEAYYAALYGQGMSGGFSSAAAPVAETAAEPSAATTVAGATAVSESSSTDTAAADSSVLDPGVAGSSSAGDAKPSDQLPPLADQGCYGKAQAEVYGDQMQGGNGGADAQFQDMWDAFNSLYTNIDKDPRLVAVVGAWVGCMSDAGYPGFTKIQDSMDQVNQRWGDLNGYQYQSSDGSGGGAVAVATVEAQTGAPTVPDPVAVTAFHDYEIKIALADFDCKAAGNYEAKYDEVRIELEKQFITDHQDELNQYRDLINTGGG